MSSSVSGASVEGEAAALGRRARVRRWVRWAVVGAAVVFGVGAWYWYLLQPRPFKLVVLRGKEADWTGQVKRLVVSHVNDPLGRYLYLWGVGKDETRSSFWQFDLEREEIAAEVTEGTASATDRVYHVWPQSCSGAIVRLHAVESAKTPTGARPGGLAQALAQTWNQVLYESPWPPDPVQSWEWDSDGQKLSFVGPGPVPAGGQWAMVSPDGTLSVDVSPVGRLEVRRNSTRRVQAEFPLAWGRTQQYFWLADSKSFVVFDDQTVRWIEVETKKVIWERSHARLLAELTGEPEVELQKGSKRPLAQIGLWPGAGYWIGSHEGQGTVAPITLFRDVQQQLPKGAQQVLTYLWELPANKWTALGSGFEAGGTVDPQGRFRIDFVQDEGPDKRRTMIVRTTIGPQATREVLATGVPAAVASQVVGNPPRLVWTTDDSELWMVQLEGKLKARRIWPKNKEE